MSLSTVRVYPSMIVHMTTGTRNEDEIIYHHHTLCGRDVVAYPTEDEINCQSCIYTYNRIKKLSIEMQRRLGVIGP